MVVVTYGSALPQYSDTHHFQSVFPEQSWNSVVGKDTGSGWGRELKRRGDDHAYMYSYKDSNSVFYFKNHCQSVMQTRACLL